jgi:hypothetical protein
MHMQGLGQISTDIAVGRDAGVRLAVPSQIPVEWMLEYRACIELELGCSLDQTVTLEVEFPFDDLAAEVLLGDGRVVPSDPVAMAAKPHLRALRFCGVPQMRLLVGERRVLDRDSWKSTFVKAAFAMNFDFQDAPVVALVGEVLDPAYGNQATTDKLCLVMRQVDVPRFLPYLYGWQASGLKRIVVFGDKDQFVDPATNGWDRVLLDENVQAMVRRDFEMFLERREWFRERAVPWRRGYLLHGPPGNGKTSVIRAMVSDARVQAFSLNLASPNAYDGQLTEAFERAAAAAPGIILLEDMDRLFSKLEKSDCGVSLGHLLNCLDGAGNQEGVIVVATANHPEVLDAAVLKRPGRFDRVVHFGLPDEALRKRYVMKVSRQAFSDADYTVIAAACERFSFAQIREVWLLASMVGFEREREATVADWLDAVARVRAEQSVGKGRPVGFDTKQ